MAKKRLSIYKCELCGNIVELEHVGGGVLVCCGQEMVLKIENSVEASKEKHIPVLTKIDGGYKVEVGSIAHPMEDKHYIEWIEIVSDNMVYRKFLKPNEKPEATFITNETNFYVRAYCNLHGLWKNE